MNTPIFDPDGVGVDNGNYFGMPFSPAESALVLVSVPWDVTSSYGTGSSYAPDAIIEASTQLDFYDPVSPDAWRRGIATIPVDYTIQEMSHRLRADAERVIEHLEQGGDASSESVLRRLRRINEGSVRMNESVYGQCRRWLAAGKITGLVGGEHSTSYGAVRAVAGHVESFGILHLDAHRDLRRCYEGFEYSHASVMYNILRDIPQVSRLVQVGIRDWCYAEQALADADPRICSFGGDMLSRSLFEGRTWQSLCDEIVGCLPHDVYISMDIDALTIENCPHTGTPVVGGLTFDQTVYLMNRVAESGRRIAGFDVVEVVPDMNDRIDAVAGARMLYKMCGIALKSNE